MLKKIKFSFTTKKQWISVNYSNSKVMNWKNCITYYLHNFQGLVDCSCKLPPHDEPCLECDEPEAHHAGALCEIVAECAPRLIFFFGRLLCQLEVLLFGTQHLMMVHWIHSGHIYYTWKILAAEYKCCVLTNLLKQSNFIFFKDVI